MHGIEATLLPGEFGGLQGGSGVDQPLVQFELEADRGSQPIDPFLGPGHVGGGQDLLAWPTFRRDLRMELKRYPFDLDVVFPLQPFDPDRVDVTEGSDVVRVDAHRGGHPPRIAGTIQVSTRGSRLPI